MSMFALIICIIQGIEPLIEGKYMYTDFVAFWCLQYSKIYKKISIFSEVQD